MKLIKKILSVFLCLTVIIGSLSVGSFSVSAASVKGNRGADGKGFIYKKTAEYTYTDANGKKHSQHYEGWENFKVHFFAPSGKTLNFLDYTQRAYCIEPDKASELTSSATVKSTSQSAAWKQLTTAQQNAVNLILSWGFGGFESPSKNKVHYYYATQLLIFEIVAGKRNASTFDAVSGKPLLTPAHTMTETSSAETTVANVTTAYDNMVSWCKRSVRNPSYTASSLSSAKSYQMSYNQSNGQYSITLTDKNGTASVTKASDVIVSNSNVKVSVSGKKITFTCSKNLGTTVNVTMKNSFLKEHGIKSKNSLYLITSNDYASYQTFAQGSNYTVKDGYVKLTFPDVVKLQLHKSSSNKELTAGNGCYSLSGAEYGIYTDKACTKKIGSITTNASGYGSYSKYVDASASYYAKETKAPKGYELDETVYTFVNSGKKAADGTKIYSFSCTDEPVDDPVGIVLQKKNAITGETTSQGLGGAVFSIEYYAQEIDKDYDVKADETAPALDSKNLKRTWYIQTDEDGYAELNKNYLADGYNSDSACASLYDKLTTSADGKGTFAKSVDVGKTYYIKEITAPTGYELDNTVYPVIANEENSTVETAVIQTIYEDAIKADLKIKKSSTDGIVSNLWFAISDSLGNEYNAVSTDKNGEATVKGLRVYDDKGNKITYTVKELGFKTTLGSHSYGGYTWTIKKENAINYKGSYFEGVSNAVFSNCEDAYSRYYYGKSSEAKSNANGKSLTLDESKTVTFNFQNTVSETDLTVKKTSYNGKVSGVWFGVQDENGKYYGDIVTDSTGTANYYSRYGEKLKSCLTVPNSAICIPIKYKVVEKGFLGGGSYYFPDNYLEKAESEFKTANKYGTTSTLNYSVYNAPATGSININKTSEDGVIEGLSFKLESFDDEREYGDDLIPTPMAYDADGNGITSIVLTTDENGKASTDNMQFYDINGNKIDGILPYVVDLNGFQITYRLTEIGIKQSDGTYKFPSRYELKDAVEFTIYDTDEYNYTYDCANTVKTGLLQVQKTSEDDVVDGLYFEISCADTGFNEKVSTNLEGLSPEISDLPIYNSNDELLKYKVSELGVLNDDGTYSLPYKYNKPKSVTVTLDTDTVTFASIKNTVKTGSVKLTKTDGTKALGGSGWQLYKSDDTPVRCIQNGTGSYMYLSESESATDCMATNGTLLIRKLPVGDYYFVESVTPSGYMPYGKKVEFTISADNENTLNMSLTVADNKSVLSQTGGGGIAPFYFVAVALGAMAIIFIYDYHKHGSKKYKKSRKENQK